MARLIYSAITSLDGQVADALGGFDWAMPDEQVHSFVNELERPLGTYLYGRRMYEVMRVWETWPVEGASAVSRDFAAIWRAADKIVYSRTLDSVSTPRTRLEREFDPAAVRHLVASAERDLGVGGPGLAAQALQAELVSELHQIVAPVVVGGGTHWLPADVRLDLDLLEERRFANGMVSLRYQVG
jgi:dihydrofolate reductase